MELDRIHVGGIAIAVLAYTVTQTLLTAVVGTGPLGRFLLGAVVPLAAGLLLTTVGVVLAVGPFSKLYVDTVARWTYVGGVGMLLVFGAATIVSGNETMVVDQVTLASTVALAGSIGGAVMGERVAVGKRRRQALETQAEVGELINGLLRHEVLNAATIIDGMAELVNEDDDGRAVGAIRDSVDRLEMTVSSVGAITGTASERRSTNVESLVREEARELESQVPHAEIDVGEIPTDAYVLADERLRTVLAKAFEWIVEYDHSPRARVDVASKQDCVEIEVATGTNEGAAGPGTHRESGYDTPSAEFTVRAIELLVDYHDSSVAFDGATEDCREPPIRLRLPRTTPTENGVTPAGIGTDSIHAAVLAGLLGGVVMGSLIQATSGQMAVIGALYGIESSLVGWITHLFHSITFALLFAVGLSGSRFDERARDLPRVGALGALFGLGLAVFAAGLLMPVWLRLLGVSTPIPSISTTGVVGHLLWGLLVGTTYRLAGPFLVEMPDDFADGLFDRIRQVLDSYDERL